MWSQQNILNSDSDSPLTNYLDDNSEIEDGDFIFLNNVKYFNSLKKEKPLGNIDLKPSARQV